MGAVTTGQTRTPKLLDLHVVAAHMLSCFSFASGYDVSAVNVHSFDRESAFP